MSDLFVIVDMLNDFISPTGKLYFPRGQAVVEPLGRLKSVLRSANTPVLYVNDAHPVNSAEFADWPPHCLVGSWGGRIIDELAPEPGDLVLHKDALTFFSVPLAEHLLRSLGVTHLYMAGVATEYCVQACALDALARGLRITVAQDAIASVDITPGDGDRALTAMRQAGATLTDCETIIGRL